MPVSKGAKLVRTAMILGLNLLLIGGGIALTLEYLHKRDRAARGELSGTVAGADSEPGVQEAPIEPALVDAGTTGRPAGGDAAASAPIPSPGANTNTDNSRTPSTRADAGSASEGGRSTTPTPSPTRVADAGAAPRALRSIDAGSQQVLSPDEEAARVRVLAAQISLVVQSHQAQLKRCYESASKVTTPDRPIEGRIDVRFSVQGDGSASSVRTSSNDTGSAALENCLLGLVRSWTFPASGAEALDFVWPFEFQAPK